MSGRRLRPRCPRRPCPSRTRHLARPQLRDILAPRRGQQVGETLAACAEREVLEETGVRVTASQMLLLREHIAGNHPESNIPWETGHHRVEAIFWCEIQHEPVTLGGTHHDYDQTGIEWVPLIKVASLPMIPPFLQRLLPGLAAQAAAGTAHAFYAGDIE
ncbi:NUDIX domain-containing protein [Streptomyces sp. ET3-23]|uniref:NUDIX domain-containing protein n=1 Tax=Streptomyces sp. ET3-23 TaxID=2885643 RepID=UPI001D0F5E02|nr:NUDIX domain-containing protein [Streptomyces sp. ET3-23]MCC2276158.1 NUDIX domain-containing protein [Streptomyces sp. ET3-23]